MHIQQSFINREGGGAGEEGAAYERHLCFLKDQTFVGKLGRKSEPVLILMTHCLFKVRKKVGLKTNDML